MYIFVQISFYLFTFCPGPDEIFPTLKVFSEQFERDSVCFRDCFSNRVPQKDGFK